MNWLSWLLVSIAAAAFFALGWPAEMLAQRPSPRAGLAWAGLTFAVPALVWLAIAVLYSAFGGTDSEYGGFAFFLAYPPSVIAVFAGTLSARAVNRVVVVRKRSSLKP